MSNLYKIVKQTIEAKDLKEAQEIFYGKNGFVINTQEYYQNIISSFIKKKETIIKKENNKLVFDLNNYKDIWNLVFLAEYIKQNDLLYKRYKQLQEEIENYENKLTEIVLKHRAPNLTAEDHEKINLEYNNLRAVVEEKKREQSAMSKVKEVFDEIEWVSLDNIIIIPNDLDKYINTLKQAVNICHKLRCIIEHGNVNENKIIQLSDDGFSVEIPIEYIEGFNYGKIIAKESDKVIVNITNRIVSPILEFLNYDIRKIDSFFYNVNPIFLERLLKYFDYDINKIYELPYEIFYDTDSINNFIDKIGIENVLKLPPYAFSNTSGLQFLLDDLKEFFQNSTNDNKNYDYSNLIDYISQLPIGCYKEPKSARIFLKANIQLEDISKIPNTGIDDFQHAFMFPEKTVILINKFGIDIVSKLSYDVFNNGGNTEDYYNELETFINMYKDDNDFDMIPHAAYCYPKNAIRIITAMGGIKNITKMSYSAFDNPDKIIRLISDIGRDNVAKVPDILFMILYKDKYDEIKATFTQINDFNKLLELPENINYYGNFIPTDFIKLINEININNISKIDKSIYTNPAKTIELIELLKKELNIDINNNIDFFTKLPINFFEYPNETMKVVKNLYSHKHDLDYIIKFVGKLDNVIFSRELTDNVIDSIELLGDEKINELSNFKCHDGNASKFSTENVWIRYFVELYGKENVKKMSPHAFQYPENTLTLISNLKGNRTDDNIIKIISKFPHGAFKYPNNTIKLINNYGIDINDISKLNNDYNEITLGFAMDNLFEHVENAVNLIKTIGIDNINKLDEIVLYHMENPSIVANITTLLNLVGNDYSRLKQFPSELYSCDISELDKLIKKYNKNVSSSIFGTDNPKIVATLVYFDSVLKKYQKQNNDASLIDIDSDKVITTIQENEYLAQFNNRADNKEYILDKLRNSAAHFRFILIKDSNGNLVDDKIYLYDKDDNSPNNNFYTTIDIHELYEITRCIEIELNNNKYNPNSTIIENNKYRR